MATPFLTSLDVYYPNIQDWYVNQVVANLYDPRHVVLLAKEDSQIVGMALGKKEPGETKLRCVRVIPELQSSGLGIRLIDKMVDLLETDKPHCTVSEELLHQYSRIFVNRYGFALSQVDKGRYRTGKLEYCFN